MRAFLFLSCFLFSQLFADVPINTSDFDDATEGFVDVQTGSLYCRSMGSGDAFLVIHDGPGLSEDYLLPKLSWFQKRGQVVFYDQQGCGKSTGDITADTITLSNYASQLESVREHYSLDNVTLVAHGFGALVAIEYLASRDASHVKGLILIDPFPLNSDDFAKFVKQSNKAQAPVQATLDQIKQSPSFLAGDSDAVANYYHTLYGTWCDNAESANKLNFFFTPQAALNGFQTAALFQQNLFSGDWDFTNALNSINVPVLLVAGDSSPIPNSAIRSYRKGISNVTFTQIKNSGHFPYVEQGNDLFSAIRSYLKSN